MSKKLQINITSEGTQGRVDIIGNISEWGDNNAIDFRERCQALKDAGVTACLVYLMTNGGDCFQANEIVNILIEIFGTYTGEGGAIVASAGTYVAVNATSFVMAKNGQFMIHKPSGYVGGNETEMENYLKLLKNMTVAYYDAYKAKLKTPEADFKTKWDSGDIWMTADEAKTYGFVTTVKEPIKITQAIALDIVAIGSPIKIDPQDIINSKPNTKNEMNLQVTAKALGLPDTATEDEVNAKLAQNAQKAKDYDALKASTDLKEKELNAANIKTELDKAEKEHRIKADTRGNWEQMLTANFAGTKAVLDSIQPVVALSTEIKASVDGKGATYQGKTFEQMQDENPIMLAELEDEKPEAYAALFADWKTRNRIK